MQEVRNKETTRLLTLYGNLGKYLIAIVLDFDKSLNFVADSCPQRFIGTLKKFTEEEFDKQITWLETTDVMDRKELKDWAKSQGFVVRTKYKKEKCVCGGYSGWCGDVYFPPCPFVDEDYRPKWLATNHVIVLKRAPNGVLPKYKHLGSFRKHYKKKPTAKKPVR